MIPTPFLFAVRSSRRRNVSVWLSGAAEFGRGRYPPYRVAAADWIDDQALQDCDEWPGTAIFAVEPVGEPVIS
jgi:hypothetical protein